MNDAVEILERSRIELRQSLKLMAGLCVDALAGGTDNELRPVLGMARTMTQLIERHLDKVRRINEAVGQAPAEVVQFPAPDEPEVR